MAKKIQKFYVVWEGNKKGVFNTWEECQVQIKGFTDAKYKAFLSLDIAQKAFSEGYKKHIFKKREGKTIFSDDIIYLSAPILESISVDAACISTKGKMEYQGVYTRNKTIIFKQGPFEKATNNIGEFLAIVHALAYCKKNNVRLPIYSDSITALSWVRKKKANTKQETNELNTVVFDLIARAEKWLYENKYENKLLKWNTQAWGEIPADYGRK